MYINTLQIRTGPYGVTGSYNCSVANLLGSDTETITVKGKLNLKLSLK